MAALPTPEFGAADKLFQGFGVLLAVGGLIGLFRTFGRQEDVDQSGSTGRPDGAQENGGFVAVPPFENFGAANEWSNPFRESRPDPDQRLDNAPDDELVLVTEYESGTEAALANGFLRSEGVPSLLTYRVRGPAYSWKQPGDAGNLLVVPRSFLSQARQLLESKVSDQELAKQAEAEKPPADN